MGNPREYFLDLSDYTKPSLFKLDETIYPDVGWFNANRASDRVFHSVDGVEGLVVHATAGGSTSGALAWWKDPEGAKASAHWIIPDEDEPAHGKSALAVVYESLAAWHVRNDKTHELVNNKKRINHWTLGVEVVNRQIESDSFSEWQLQMTAQITRYAWAKYPNFRYVFSHALVDPLRRSDPGVNFDWEKFKAMVLSDSRDPEADANASVIAASVEARVGLEEFEGKDSCCMSS